MTEVGRAMSDTAFSRPIPRRFAGVGVSGERVCALGLVTLQLGLIGYLSGSLWFSLLTAVPALVGTFSRWRVTIAPDRQLVLVLVAFVVFLLKFRFAPHPFPAYVLFIRTELLHEMACCLVLLQSMHFIVRQPGDRLSPLLPVFGAVAVIFACDVHANFSQRQVTRLLVATYVVGWGLFQVAWHRHRALQPMGAGTGSRARLWSVGLVLALVVGFTWTFSRGMDRFHGPVDDWFVSKLEVLFMRWFGTSQIAAPVGFSDQARLGSLRRRKTEDELQIALRAFSQNEPGYLRGRCYPTLSDGEWRTAPRTGRPPLAPVSGTPEGLHDAAPRGEFFRHPDLILPPQRAWVDTEIWLEPSLAGMAFTPPETTHLQTTADNVGFAGNGLFDLSGSDGAEYTAWSPGPLPPSELHHFELRRLVELPDAYRAAADKLAAEVFREAETPEEKIAAVERYFHMNYQYRLGIEIPEHADPVLYFLRKRPAAHCEYFATGAAVLLRSAGVPTRYTTGFVAAERNEFGDYWLARNRDAHAWCEAYIDGQGWVIVEATPPAGVPSPIPASLGQQWWESFRAALARLRLNLAQGELSGAWKTLWSGTLAVPAALLFAGLAVWIVWRFPWWRGRADQPKWPSDPLERQLVLLLSAVDRRLLRYGFERRTGETLHQFADRLTRPELRERPAGPQRSELPEFPPETAAVVAAWYRGYAQLRYTRRPDERSIDELRAAVPAV
jgi:hypothetical protein